MMATRVRRTGQVFLGVINILALIGVVAVALVVGHVVWRPSTDKPSVTTFLTESLQSVAQLVSTKEHVFAVIKYDKSEKLFRFIPVDSEHVVAIARGYVNLGIDLQGVTPTFNESDKTAAITVPHAKILDVVTEPVAYLSVRTGLPFHFTHEQAHEVDSIARVRVAQAADSLGIRQHADSNVVSALTNMFAKSGYNLTVRFQ